MRPISLDLLHLTAAERRRVYKKRWRDRNKHLTAAKDRQRARAWRKANPDKKRAHTRRYREARRSQFCSYKHKYRTQQLDNGGSFTAAEWEQLKKAYGYTCLCCGKTEPEIKLTADHVIPVSEGGTSFIDNIQPLCGKCNSRKNSKIIDFRTIWSSQSFNSRGTEPSATASQNH